jgi:HK97 gp10 family phage protein
MVKEIGRQAVKARVLRGVRGPEAITEIGKALFVGGNLIQTDAQHSITNGSVSGKAHVPSAPGEPPNADTHALDRQIETVQVGPLRVQVQSNDPKSKFLELGTSRMAARPFLLPAGRRQQPKVTRLVTDAVNRVNKRR